MAEADDRLPEELRELGRSLRVPDVDGETMAERVLAQLLAEREAGAGPVAGPVPGAGAGTGTGVPRRRPAGLRRCFERLRRRWRALLAAVSGVLVIAVLTPPVRATVGDWLGFGGVSVRHDAGASAGAGAPGASVPGCPEPVPLAEAARRAGFQPLIPSALGAPDAVSVTGSAERGRAVISLCWTGGTGGGGHAGPVGRPDGPVRLDEFPARLDLGFVKQVAVQPEWTALPDGAQALWFAEAHTLTFPLEDGAGAVWTHSVRPAGPTLLWRRNGGALTLRLEGIPNRAEALRVAGSTE
ncbi:hypothetical protein [Streptomyces sp. NPDC003327]